MKNPLKSLLTWSPQKRSNLIAITAVLFFLVTLPVITLFFALQSTPLVEPAPPLQFDDAARVKQLLRENNPRKLAPGEIRSTSISERDCNRVLGYILSRSPGRNRIAVSVHFGDNTLSTKATVRLPSNPFGKHLNIDADFEPTDNIARLTRLFIGAVWVPSFLVNGARNVVEFIMSTHDDFAIFLEAAKSLKELRFEPQTAYIAYEWKKGIMRQIKRTGQNLVFNDRDQKVFIRYHQELIAVTEKEPNKNVPLHHILAPLFRLAQERTEAGEDPVRENRILILTATTYTLHKRLHRLIGTDPWEGDRESPAKRIELNGRQDLAKHFMVSAALTASMDSGLAQFAGVFKEVSDAKGGSGFSFADLLADKAGVNMGELAIASPDKAKWLQQKMAQSQSSADYMPSQDQLPEGLQEAAFKQRFQDLDSQTYRKTETEISDTISTCPLYTATP